MITRYSLCVYVQLINKRPYEGYPHLPVKNSVVVGIRTRTLSVLNEPEDKSLR